MRIAVVVFEGFDELDAIGPLEVLRNAATMGDADLQVDLVALDGAAEVTGSHGLRVRPDGRLDPEATDLLVIPGGGWNDRAPKGARAEAERGELPAAIAAAHRPGRGRHRLHRAMLATAAASPRAPGRDPPGASRSGRGPR